MFKKIKSLINQLANKKALLAGVCLTLILAGTSVLALSQIIQVKNQLAASWSREANLNQQLGQSKEQLSILKSEDQRLINQNLKEEINNIQKNYQRAMNDYEKLLDLKPVNKETQKIDSLFAQALSLLAQKNYASASAVLTDLEKEIETAKNAIASQVEKNENLAVLATPPDSGYRRQQVKTDAGTFTVDIVSADLNSTRVIVDTASANDCANDCPVLPLSDYVSRSGAFAAINGPYFCPATYPTCADKKNSFDTLLMNKDKHYFNSDNNVYSTVPAVIFYGNGARFVSQSLEWGRDTGVDAVIANQPLLVLNGELKFTGDDEAKRQSKGSRSFIGATDNKVYLGVVRSTSVVEAAKVVQALGIKSALNLDNGGSTALWYSGYKVGPGRNLPFGILLVRK